jgi:hypothetical protein
MADPTPTDAGWRIRLALDDTYPGLNPADVTVEEFDAAVAAARADERERITAVVLAALPVHTQGGWSVPVFDEFDSPWESGCVTCKRSVCQLDVVRAALAHLVDTEETDHG